MIASTIDVELLRTLLPAKVLIARLIVIDRQIDEPEDPRWEEFWQVAAVYEAAEASAHRATKWRGCIFGPGRRCPESSPVNCLACAERERRRVEAPRTESAEVTVTYE